MDGEVVGNIESSTEDMTSGQARWAHYASTNENTSDDEKDDNFSTGGVSTFSTPAISVPSAQPTVTPGAVRSYPSNHPMANSGRHLAPGGSSFAALHPITEDAADDSAAPGAHPEASSRVQQMLERKFGARDTEEQKDDDGEAVPEDLHSLLERKLGQFDNHDEEEAKQEDDGHSVATEQIANRGGSRPSLLSATSLTSSRSHHSTTSSSHSIVSDDHSADGDEPRRLGTGRTNRRRSAHAILGAQVLDSQGRTLSPEELKDLWAKTGMCTECGRVKTHQKVKAGLFWAFRRLEPLTTRGQVYKGYCLFCYEVEDLRRLLNEPDLKEEDVPRVANAMMLMRNTSVRNLNTGSALDTATLQARRASNVALRRQSVEDVQEASVAVAAGDDNAPAEEKSLRSRLTNWKFLLAAGIVLVLLIVVIVGAVVVLGGGDSTPATPPPVTPPPTVPPTQAPSMPPVASNLIWQQSGQDIVGTSDSFGHIVALSQFGDRVAISSPSDGTGGRVDVFVRATTAEGKELWISMGPPILGTADGDLAGFGMALSSDGSTLVVGYPGKGTTGAVRVFRHSTESDAWLPLGEELFGLTAGSQFGYSVDTNFDGSIIVVGAPTHIDSSDPFQDTTPGMAQVFKYLEADNVYAPLGDIVLGENDGDLFGASVQMANSGEFMAVGAPGNDEQFDEGGQIYVFVWDGVDWYENLNDQLFGDGTGHRFGSRVTMDGSGTTIAASAVDADSDGVAGAGDILTVRIDFELLIFDELGVSIPPQPGTTGLGYWTALNHLGNRIVVSSLNQNTTAGNVYVFDFGLDAFWEPTGEPILGDALGTQQWLGRGPSVAISEDGESVAIGYESIMTDQGTSSPVVRIFGYFGN